MHVQAAGSKDGEREAVRERNVREAEQIGPSVAMRLPRSTCVRAAAAPAKTCSNYQVFCAR